MKRVVVFTLLMFLVIWFGACGGEKSTPIIPDTPTQERNGEKSGQNSGHRDENNNKDENNGNGDNNDNNGEKVELQPSPLANYSEADIKQIILSMIQNVIETTPPEPDVPKKLKIQKAKLKSTEARADILDYIFIDDDTVAVVWKFWIPKGKENYGGIAVAYYDEGPDGKFNYVENPSPLWLAVVNYVSYYPSKKESYQEAVWVDKDDGKYFPEDQWEEYEVISDTQIKTVVRQKWQNGHKHRLAIFKTMFKQGNLDYWCVNETNIARNKTYAYDLFAGLLNGQVNYFTDPRMDNFQYLPINALNSLNWSVRPPTDILLNMGRKISLEISHGLVDLSGKDLLFLASQAKNAEKLDRFLKITPALPKIN